MSNATETIITNDEGTNRVGETDIITNDDGFGGLVSAVENFQLITNDEIVEDIYLEQPFHGEGTGQIML